MRLGRWIPLAAVVALLGAAMLAAVFGNPVIEPRPDGPVTRRTARPPGGDSEPTPSLVSPPASGESGSLPAWVSWAISGLCTAIILAVVIALLWLLVRDRLVQRRSRLAVDPSALPTMEETQRRVRAAVDEGLSDLDDADADPRRAVIACWVRLEQAAATAGTPREVGDTSTDLVARLLEVHLVSAVVLADFGAVYREARFATHAVDEAMREQARSALRQLRHELMAGHERMREAAGEHHDGGPPSAGAGTGQTMSGGWR